MDMRRAASCPIASEFNTFDKVVKHSEIGGMDRRSEEQMRGLRKEWVDGGHIAMRDDVHREDHIEINRWILRLLDKKTRSDEEEYIVTCVDISLNFDIPFKATKGDRDDLLRMVRMKIKDPNWTRFPR
ncbi:hypothetical protein ACVDG8_002620 [Mesorhizobium sp. ORM8.1]